MAKTLLILSSVTYAHKAKRLLEQNWIKCAVVRTPKAQQNTGCSYSLQIEPERAAEAETLIRRQGIRILRIIALP